MVETGRQMVNQLEADRTNTLLPFLGFILRSWYLSLQVMALVSVHTSTLSFPWETQYNSLGNFRDLNIKSSAKGLYGPHGMCDWPARPPMSPKDRDLPATGWLVGRSWFAILKGSPDRNEYMKITWKYMKMVQVYLQDIWNDLFAKRREHRHVKIYSRNNTNDHCSKTYGLRWIDVFRCLIEYVISRWPVRSG